MKKQSRTEIYWKARALRAEKLLESYRAWEVAIFEWHRNLVALLDNLALDIGTLSKRKEGGK